MEPKLSFYAAIQDDLAMVDQNLRDLASSGPPWLIEVLDHALLQRGKRIRPVIALLSAKLRPCDREPPVLVSTAVELLHVAALIHDDTVDNADTRRGIATASTILGPHAAVMLGDYLVAKSVHFITEIIEPRIIRRFSETAVELASGQMDEWFANFDQTQTRDQYVHRIRKKTASLFAAATESGAILNHSPQEEIANLWDYGVNLGIAFQMIDDILDFQATETEVGKPVGTDLSRGILTLPSLLLMERYPNDNPIIDLCEGRDRLENVGKAVEIIHRSDIIPDSYAIARKYLDRAHAALRSIPSSIYKQSLLDIGEYVLDRNQ